MPLLRRALARPLVWLPRDLLRELCAQAERERPCETGGMLLGWRVGDQIAIVRAIAPGPRAKRERECFEADGPWQQEQLAAAYEESGRTVTYLGDWHSHPRGPARPSARDRQTAVLVAGCPEARAPEPLTVILGRRSRRWRTRCFIYAEGRMRRAHIRVHQAAS